jgi:DNA-binding HxlR family transcriptional regulator
LQKATVVGHTGRVQRWTDLDWVDNDACSVARTLEIVGDRWSVLVLREAFLGVRRFEVMQRHLGIARTVLTDRLNRLVEHGILRREQYSERPPRSEYRLTKAGVALWPVIVALLQWGNDHLPDARPNPITISHRACGEETTFSLHCDHCGEPVTAYDVEGHLNLAANAADGGQS